MDAPIGRDKAVEIIGKAIDGLCGELLPLKAAVDDVERAEGQIKSETSV